MAYDASNEAPQTSLDQRLEGESVRALLTELATVEDAMLSLIHI